MGFNLKIRALGFVLSWMVMRGWVSWWDEKKEMVLAFGGVGL